MRKLLPAIVIALTLVTATFAAASGLVVTATPTPVTVLSAGSMQQFSATTTGGGPVSVFWAVSGTGCSGFGCGSITARGGLYTAPASLSSSIFVTITAASTRDFSSTGSVTITVNPSGGGGGGTVSITPPGPLQLSVGASQTFTANTSVTWSVGGPCGGNCGTITTAGVYTAPAALSSAVSATITAMTVATPSASASVTVEVVPVVAVSIGPFNAQMSPGTSQQLSATVTGTSIPTVRWSVSGAGCSGSSCGTISASGRYTAPASVASTLNVIVKATANADSSKFATAAIAVGPIVAVSVSPSGLSLSVGAAQQYSVSVTGTSSTAVNWTVTGAGCSGAACGTVSTIGLYQAPASIPSPANVSITAALSSDSSKSGSATATIVPLSNSRLSGNYAFLFRGFDAAGPYQAAGSFIADGNGNLNSGIEDINCGLGATDTICASGPLSEQAFTGTYTVNADGRGTFAITPTGGAPAQTFTLAVESSNAKARFIESDASGIRGSGVLELQTTSAFTTSALSSHFAFNLTGLDSVGLPIATIGNMVFLPPSPPYTLTPTISAGVIDVNDNGLVSCYPKEVPLGSGSSCLSVGTNRFTGTYTVDPSGRGTAQFAIQGFDGNSADSTTFNFSLYVISPTEFFLLSLDPGMSTNPVFSGQALEQQVQPANAFQPGPAIISWSGSSSVPTGSAAGTLGTPQAAVGQASIFDNTGNIIGLNYDLNKGGVMSWANDQGLCSTTTKRGKIVPSTSCAYALQANNDILIVVNRAAFARIFPTSTNTGFVLGPGVTVGKIEPQLVAFPSPFTFGSDLMVAPSTSLISGTGSLIQKTGSAGPVTGNADESIAAPPAFIPDLSFTGTFGPTMIPSSGRAFMTLNSTDMTAVDFWVVTVNKMVAIDTDPGAVPNLLIFEH